jgi:hypothetical protein
MDIQVFPIYLVTVVLLLIEKWVNHKTCGIDKLNLPFYMV